MYIYIHIYTSIYTSIFSSLPNSRAFSLSRVPSSSTFGRMNFSLFFFQVERVFLVTPKREATSLLG